MPTIGEMLELEQEIGAKKFQELAEGKQDENNSGSDDEQTKKDHKKSDEEKQKFQAVKGAPLEKSSKRKPSAFFLQALNNNAHKRTDPRFSDQHGEFKQANFDKYYDFLDEVEAKEIVQLKKFKNKLAKTRIKKKAKGKSAETTEAEHEAIGAIRSREQRLKAKLDRKDDRKSENKKRKAMVEEVKQGKMPYYGKNADDRGGRDKKDNSSKDDNFSKEPKKSKRSLDRKHMPDGFRRSAKAGDGGKPRVPKPIIKKHWQ